ncbi:MAG: HAD family hydrolase, partial [Desulfobulbaceae bacterium]|nr:HAD family hydrolase [Desulfobulbaceae bacterium]
MKILFDLDGTLTDPYQGITRCISHALVTLGRPSPPRMDLRWCIGPPLKKSFVKLLSSDDDKLTEEALSIYRERFGSVGLFENEVYDDIPETLKALQEQDHILYVATSKPRVYAERIIDHFDLDQYFSGIYGSELDGTRSDKSSLISHILQSESIASTEAAMIGDREYDMIGAKANGVRGFGVLWGFGTKDELETSGAYTCVKKPQELITTIA